MFCQLLDILPKTLIFKIIFDSNLSYIEVWFTDQNSKPLEIENEINITPDIKGKADNQKWCVIQFKLQIKHL